MQSQGSTSSQPSFDSLSSSDSLLLSDSDQVEDDADVFLTDSPSTGGAAATDAGSGDVGSESPGSQWMCDGSTDKEEEEESSYGPRSGVKGGDAGLEEAGQVTKSEGDLIFAQKVRNLRMRPDGGDRMSRMSRVNSLSGNLSLVLPLVSVRGAAGLHPTAAGAAEWTEEGPV